MDLSKECLDVNGSDNQVPFHVPPHTDINTLTEVLVISQLKKEARGSVDKLNGLRVLHVHGTYAHTLCLGGGGGRGWEWRFYPLCIFKFNRVYAISLYNCHTISEYNIFKIFI